MRTTLYCLGIALALRVAFDQLVAQSADPTPPEAHAYFMPGKLALEWHFKDEYRVWLSANSSDLAGWAKEGYNPSFTYLLSQYKPIVKRAKDGQWQITFTSEIAEDLP